MKMKVWLKEPNGEVLAPDDAAACWISAQHNALVLAVLHQRYPYETVEKIWADDDVRLMVQESDGVITWLLDGNPLMRFHPVEVGFEGAVLHVGQQYEVFG